MFVIPIVPAVISITGLIFLLGLFLIDSRYKVVLKAGALIWTIVGAYFAYEAVSNSFGWPYHAQPPEKFKLIWVDIERMKEPHIYLWLREVDGTPRVYEIEDNKENEKMGKELQKQILDNEGNGIYVEQEDGSGNGGRKPKSQNGDDGSPDNGEHLVTGNGLKFRVKDKASLLPSK